MGAGHIQSMNLLNAGCRGGRPAGATMANADLVIENLTEFAAAGMASSCVPCQLSIADYLVR